jgi:hypothetical protein
MSLGSRNRANDGKQLKIIFIKTATGIPIAAKINPTPGILDNPANMNNGTCKTNQRIEIKEITSKLTKGITAITPIRFLIIIAGIKDKNKAKVFTE